MKLSKLTTIAALSIGLVAASVSTDAQAGPAADLAKVCAREHASDAALKAAEAKFEAAKKAENEADKALEAAKAKEAETDALRAEAAKELAKAIEIEKSLDSKEARAIAAARRRAASNNARIARLENLASRLQSSVARNNKLLETEKNGQAATCSAPQLDPANKDKFSAEDIKEAQQACAEDKAEVKELQDDIAGAEKKLAAVQREIASLKAQNARLAKITEVCKKG